MRGSCKGWMNNMCDILTNIDTYAYKRYSGKQTILVYTLSQKKLLRLTKSVGAYSWLTAVWILVITFKHFVFLFFDRDLKLANSLWVFFAKHTHCIFETMFLWLLLIAFTRLEKTLLASINKQKAFLKIHIRWFTILI